VEQGLAAEKPDVANAPPVQDVQGWLEAIGVDPAQIGGAHFSARKIAKVAGGVASVGHGYIAQRWPAMTDEPQHIPSL
jgi:hypothetical protein